MRWRHSCSRRRTPRTSARLAGGSSSCPEDLLPLGHCERENLRLEVIGILEPLGRSVEAGIAEQAGELEHVLLAHWTPASCIEAIICSTA
jgi:hypothetical protein